MKQLSLKPALMKKGAYLLSSLLVGSLLTSCGSKTFLITSGNENLTTLTKITDSESNKAFRATGAPGNSALFIEISDKSGSHQIYKKINPLTPSLIQVTNDANSNCSFPSYCTKTDRLAFSKVANKGWGRSDLYMMPATKGTALIPVTETSDENEFNPSFNSEGTKLAYQKSKGTDANIDSEIWVKDLTTGETMLIGKGCSPKISPDGTKIVFTKFNGPNESHLWIMNLDGSEASQISGSKQEFARHPAWSPDGKYIVFQNYLSNKKKDFDLFVIGVDGTNLRQITNNESQDLTPYWSEDGYIYFTSDRGGKANNYQIWRFKYIAD